MVIFQFIQPIKSQTNTIDYSPALREKCGWLQQGRDQETNEWNSEWGLTQVEFSIAKYNGVTSPAKKLLRSM